MMIGAIAHYHSFIALFLRMFRSDTDAKPYAERYEVLRDDRLTCSQILFVNPASYMNIAVQYSSVPVYDMIYDVAHKIGGICVISKLNLLHPNIMHLTMFCPMPLFIMIVDTVSTWNNFIV